MPPPETYKSEIGSQSTTCQVHAGPYVSLLAPGKTDYTACHPRKTSTYILHVSIVSITTHTHNRRKSIGKNKQRTKKRNKNKYGCMGPRKRKEIYILGAYWRVCHQNGMSRGFSTVYSSTTNDFRYTHRSTDYRSITRSTAGRGCHVPLCWGPFALPLVGSCLGKTCGVLDGLTAAAHQNVRSYDVSFLQEM